ncbi:MAG: periplasmic heavy metal sensor, partial [Verrucomicrobiae bacterium]|nr:periplasmic heavy metal sensor [Verrucomicrobiae bacterium]
MKKPLLFLLAAALTCLLAFGLGYVYFSKMHGRSLAIDDSVKAVDWLRREFSLPPAELEKVQALHREYEPRCMEYCSRVETSNARLKLLLENSRGMTPALQSALDENARLKAECRTAMTEHIYRVAAVMSPDAATR